MKQIYPDTKAKRMAEITLLMDNNLILHSYILRDVSFIIMLIAMAFL